MRNTPDVWAILGKTSWRRDSVLRDVRRLTLWAMLLTSVWVAWGCGSWGWDTMIDPHDSISDVGGPAMNTPQYSTIQPTNGPVTVTISTSADTTTPAGWTKISSWGLNIFSHTYTQNTTETVFFANVSDGKKTWIDVIVKNITL